MKREQNSIDIEPTNHLKKNEQLSANQVSFL